MNFDYLNSAKRINYLHRETFSGSNFILATALNISLALIAIAIFYFVGKSALGIAEIMMAVSIFSQSYILAKKYYRISPKSENLADRFEDDLIELFEISIKEAKKENINIITPEYLFDRCSLITVGKIIFMRLGLPSVEKIKGLSKLKQVSFNDEITALFADIKQVKINLTDFLNALCDGRPLIKAYLAEFKITSQDFSVVSNWINRIKNLAKNKHFWDKETGPAGVGEEWSYGYTPTLSLYSYDLSKYFGDTDIQINLFGHQGKLTEIETVLAKAQKNNCLLVGEPGVGKKTLVNAFALKLAKGDTLKALKYKRIRQIDIGRILAGGNVGVWTDRLEQALSDAVEAGNIIIYIDNFQSLLGGTDNSLKIGGIDATEILLPYLEKSGIHVIASISPNDYYSILRRKEGIVNSFEKVEVSPATPEDTEAILLETLPFIEQKYNCFIPFKTIKTAVSLADRYIHDVPFPEKALRLIEQAAVGLGGKKLEIMRPENVEKLVSQKTNVPVGEVQNQEKEKLLNLESFLHKRVIGQDEAIKAVADTLRRLRSGLTSGRRPAGVFLFLGPTGVGKTETARALAESYFGSEKQMIRLDMSEYQQPNSIDRLIGSASNTSGQLTDAVLANPFSLILLDELEKADKSILNLFLQVFEDGRLTDAMGRTSDFTNTVIIATSNAGAELIRERVSAGSIEGLKQQFIDSLQQQGIFTPEFINRFDGVVVFKPLTQDELLKVAQLMIDSINKNLAEKRISVQVAPDALTKLVQLGYDPQFGARPMRRVITEKVENLLAKKMLEGTIQEGQNMAININDIN